jgi:hypothetical protein
MVVAAGASTCSGSGRRWRLPRSGGDGRRRSIGRRRGAQRSACSREEATVVALYTRLHFASKKGGGRKGPGRDKLAECRPASARAGGPAWRVWRGRHTAGARASRPLEARVASACAPRHARRRGGPGRRGTMAPRGSTRAGALSAESHRDVAVTSSGCATLTAKISKIFNRTPPNFVYQSCRESIGEYFSQRPTYVLIHHLSMNCRQSCWFQWLW